MRNPHTIIALCMTLACSHLATGAAASGERWHNALAPRGEPGHELTLARDGATDYVIVMPDPFTSQERKAAEELALWLGRMTGARFALPRFPVLQNPDFEEGAPWPDGGFPGGWDPPPDGYGSPARAQSGPHAIGGSGTSAYMAIGARSGMQQTGLNPGSARWTLDMDFATEDPPPEGDACSMYMSLVTGGGGAITFLVKDASDDGRGEFYFRDGRNNDRGWLLLDDAIQFDDDVRETPLTHHLRIVARFDDPEPNYDVVLTDPDGTTHEARGIRNFSSPVEQGDTIVSITTYTAWNVAAHLLDNVSITVPEEAQPALLPPPAPGGKFISIGRTPQLAAADPPQAQEDLGEEGYAIVQEGDSLFLFGGSRRGPIFAVLALLEEDLGCRWYTSGVSATFANVHRVPTRPTLTFRPVTRTYVPPFEVRDPYYHEAWEGVWALRNRTSGQWTSVGEHWGGQNDYAIRTHTFNTLVPKSTYFATNPEYFMLDLDGERVDLQLCPSNPDILPIAAKAMKDALASHPRAEYIALAANDGNWRCHCVPCRTLDKAADPGAFCHHCFIMHYSSAGALLHMANELGAMIEEEFPDALIMAQAYLSSQRAPVNARIRDNVAIELCNHTQLLNWPVDWTTSDDPNAREYREQVDKWSGLTPNLHIWEYTSNYPHIMMVTPNMTHIAAATRWYADHGVKGVMYQGNHGTTRCAERALMRVWVMAKLLWDPSRDVGSLQQDFIRGFYGAAAPAMSDYYALLDDLGNGKLAPADGPAAGVPGIASGKGPWARPFVTRADAIFDRAEGMAENDTIRARVQLERASVLYLKLENGPDFVTDLGQDYGALIDQFDRIVRPQKTSRLGYRHTLDGKLEEWRKR